MGETELLLGLTVLLCIGILLYAMYEAVMLWARQDRRRMDERLSDYTRKSSYWNEGEQ